MTQVVTKGPWYSNQSGKAEHEVLHDISAVSTKMASDIVDVSGFLDEVGVQSEQQMNEMEGLRSRVDGIISSNETLHNAIAEVSSHSNENLESLRSSMESFKSSAEASQQVASWVQSVENRITSVVETLKKVEKLNDEITSIARQVNILAINAKIEAVRAGTHGRGFAVVAEAINDLSRNTGRAAEAVSEGVESLGSNFTELREEATGMHSVAGQVLNEVALTNEKMTDMSQQMEATVRTASSMKSNADQITETIHAFGPVFDKLATSAQDTSNGVSVSRKRIHALVDDSETVVRLAIIGGGATEDRKFIDFARKTATDIGKLFEESVRNGIISEGELFDYTYTPIPNTNPQQVLARFTRFTDSTLPHFQESAFQLDPRVVFCATVDVNGYLPTHNLKFSHPQGNDPVWNTSHSRNRRIFDDRVGLKAGKSTEPFLMQVYRRDMGGGEFAMMKDLSAPITVNGRHWGGLRLAYTI